MAAALILARLRRIPHGQRNRGILQPSACQEGSGMERTRREALLAAVAAALAPAQARAGAPEPAAPAAPVQSPPSGSDAEGSVAAGRDPFAHLTAPVMLNGHGPYPFVVDTGASISCVSRRLAEALGLAIQEKRLVHTIVGAKLQPMALIDELRVGVRRERRTAALAIPIEQPQIEGVLAVDWLRNQRVTLDFANSRLDFAASHAERSEPGRVVVPARRRLGQLTMIDADLGERRISAMVDSGSEVSLCNSAMLALLDKVQAVPARKEIIYMVSVIGETFAGELIYLPFFRLGGLRLGNVGVVHSDAHIFALWGLMDTPAVLLGMDLLRQFRAVSLDFGRSQVRFDLFQSQV
jgi:predicted aspartyl protease